jgi:hypothetical protein
MCASVGNKVCTNVGERARNVLLTEFLLEPTLEPSWPPTWNNKQKLPIVIKKAGCFSGFASLEVQNLKSLSLFLPKEFWKKGWKKTLLTRQPTLGLAKRRFWQCVGLFFSFLAVMHRCQIVEKS